MWSPMSKTETQRDIVSLAKFLIVGVANTIIGLMIIYFSKWVLGLGDVAANISGYGIALLFSFILNKRWSFSHDGPTMSAFVRFVAVIALAYLTNLATVLILIEYLSVNSYLAQSLGIIPYTGLSFLGFRYFAFAKSVEDQT